MSYGDDKAGYRVIVASDWLEDIKKFAAKEEEDGDDGFMSRYRYSASRGKVKIDVAEWKESSLKKLAEFLDKKAAAGDGSAKLSRGVLQQWIEIRNNPSGSTVSRFENLAESLKKYISTSEKRWVFEQIADGNMIPWFVAEVSYHPPSQHSRAHVSIGLMAINSGHSNRRGNSDKSRSVYVLPEEFNKKLTMGQYLELKGLHLETPARVKSYEVEVEKFMEFYDEDGLQMSVKGKAYLHSGWSNSGFRSVEKSGRPAKMVINPSEKEHEESAINCEFWDKSEEKLWRLPIHPILDCFDLEEHAEYRVHINNAETYIYDTKIGSKLVLPEDTKNFIEILIEHSKNKFVDIVGGKEGGTIILLEGPPGTGKTLTAEIYSEVMERPLYKVQSSQLGTDPKTVEEELKEVLQRSERWGAILLIDEADVYIHERGDNIEQNAIVGVFLRVLEYYRGVLFMTTNRGTVTDDAIISRLTARFIYQNPDFNAQMKLWKVLAEQNNIELNDKEIQPIVTKYPHLSGRDIKNLLKLAYVVSLKNNKHIDLSLVSSIAKFRQTTEDKT
jgi:hypothetical protein